MRKNVGFQGRPADYLVPTPRAPRSKKFRDVDTTHIAFSLLPKPKDAKAKDVKPLVGILKKSGSQSKQVAPKKVQFQGKQTRMVTKWIGERQVCSLLPIMYQIIGLLTGQLGRRDRKPTGQGWGGAPWNQYPRPPKTGPNHRQPDPRLGTEGSCGGSPIYPHLCKPSDRGSRARALRQPRVQQEGHCVDPHPAPYRLGPAPKEALQLPRGPFAIHLMPCFFFALLFTEKRGNPPKKIEHPKNHTRESRTVYVHFCCRTVFTHYLFAF